MKIVEHWRPAAAAAILLLVALIAFRTIPSSRPASIRRIYVHQYVHHPNLEVFLVGFKRSITSWAERTGHTVEFREQVADGDQNIAAQIARQQAAAKPDLILALATPSAQAAVAATKDIPVLFGAITDPVSAGLVASLDSPGANVTGTCDAVRPKLLVDLIVQLLPMARRVGIVRNPGEANSNASMNHLAPALRAAGLSLEEKGVSGPGEIGLAARALIGQADLFLVPADNTVLSGLAALAAVADEQHIPLFVTDEGSVGLGAVGTVGIDYERLGSITGEMGASILGGERPAALPIRFDDKARLVLNPRAAVSQHVTLPPDLVRSAHIVGQHGRN